MIKYVQYFIAYICLILLWVLMIVTLCSLFGLFGVNTTPGIIIWGLLFGTIYHKYKPMEFEKVLEKIGMSW